MFFKKKNNDNIMFLPNNYYSPTKTFLPITSSNRMDEKNDIFAIQNKLVETQKALNEEILKKMVFKFIISFYKKKFNQEFRNSFKRATICS